MNPRAIQAAMGHASLETTMGYLHAESLGVQSPVTILEKAAMTEAYALPLTHPTPTYAARNACTNVATARTSSACPMV